jgi:HAE1 family hydrophobic/amphiphilic exporter-1
LKVSFEVGSNLDMDNVLTQNRVSQAQPQMPQSVKNYGVTVKKALAFPLLVISIKSPKGTYDSSFLSNYTTININDAIARIPGVGQINLFGGSDYAMRVWLRPDRIGRLGLTVPDIANAISQQNQLTPAGRSAAAGRAGHRVHLHRPHAGTPARRGGVRRHHPAHASPTAREVASRTSPRSSWARCSTTPSAATTASRPAVIAIFQIPGQQRARGRRPRSRRRWPTCPRASRATWSTWSRSTPRCRSPKGSTRIVHTLLEGRGAGDHRRFVFLQNWRATLIPLLTVPVSLVGAFMFFPLLGFSINVLSLLGLVLAIGIVVDDAIVVVEAVMHHIEHGHVAEGRDDQGDGGGDGPGRRHRLILCAVFVPVGFMGRASAGLPVSAVRDHDRDLGVLSVTR